MLKTTTQNLLIPRKRLYTLREAGEYLGRPTWGIRELIWSGKIPVIQDGKGGKMYLDINDLDGYIDRSKKTETEPKAVGARQKH